MKNQKGITLVALVITIIVLLILAGVSISLVVGQNGVLGKATDSVKAQKSSAIKEAVVLGINALETKYMAEWSSNQGTQRSSIYTVANLITELGTGYTVTQEGTAGTSLIGENVLVVKKGKDEVKLSFSIDASGGLTWKASDSVQIKDNGNFNTVKNV